MDDKQIIQLYYARDEQALSESQCKYGTYCYGIAMCILESREDAEECVNDTWLRAWNTIPPQNPPSLKTYLARLTRHLSIDRYRAMHAKKRDANLTQLLTELDGCAPEGEVTSTLREDLTAFLRALPDEERNLFVGRYWYAYTPKVLAAHFGLSRNAVNLRLMRTREKLKAYLTERGYTI